MRVGEGLNEGVCLGGSLLDSVAGFGDNGIFGFETCYPGYGDAVMCAINVRPLLRVYGDTDGFVGFSLGVSLLTYS